jgi:cytoskeletal protein CcmA (bactofilin family)
MEGKMMEEYPLSDLVINGVSGAAGGTYENVRIEGVGKVSGTIVARRFNGNGHIRLKADITADELECNGTMNVKGNMKFGNMKVDGLLTIGGGVSGESCELNGMMSIKGDCELEHFTGKGGLHGWRIVQCGSIGLLPAGTGESK